MSGRDNTRNDNRDGDAQRRREAMPGRVGKYRVDHVIGRGAAGIVYKGYDEQIDRPLAIKTLRPEVIDEMGDSAEFLRRFSAEARSAGRCLHPNIVTVFDFVEQDGAPYIIMEYVNAGTLENVIRAPARLPIRQVGEIMAQLLFALGYAHAKGIVHRDVKPANILCPSAASIKVSDFGVAHIDALDLTRPGLGPVGTPNYMAPERFLGRPADQRADLFSAGVILFQLLTRCKPFVAADMPELVRKLMTEAAPSVSTLRGEQWPEMDAVVARALARNPEDRFEGAARFIDALNVAIETRPADQLPPLDLTRLSRPHSDEPTPSSKAGLNRTMAERLSSEAIDALSRSLAKALGPIARIVVREAAREATDVDMLLCTLTSRIEIEADKTLFRAAAERTLLDELGSAAEAISQAEIRAMTEALLPLVGPMARILVNRQAATAVGREDFYRGLAEALPNEEDRATFIALQRKMIKRSQ